MLGGTESRAQHSLNLLNYSLGTKYDFSKFIRAEGDKPHRVWKSPYDQKKLSSCRAHSSYI